ncbi:hypothetical protein VYU27_010759, partial [Nannochloropsis oceanica]
VKMSLGGENRVDGRLLALLRTMYCRDRRLFALSNVTYEGLQSYSTDFRISTFERRAIMHALGIATTLLRRLPTTLTEDWKLLTGESLYVGHDEDSRTVGPSLPSSPPPSLRSSANPSLPRETFIA